MAIRDLEMSILDVKSAYLYGELEEPTYMEQPEGFRDGTSRVCLLLHALYGLKQSGCAWNKTLDTHLKSLGYRRLNADYCVYIRQESPQIFDILSMWVDDFAIFCTKGRMARNKQEIAQKWEITDQGEEPCIIVGIQIYQEREKKRIKDPTYIGYLNASVWRMQTLLPPR
jgi:hypothetical protein